MAQKLEELSIMPTIEIVDALKILDKPQYDEDSLLDALEQVYRYSPLKSEVARKEKAIDDLVDEWFTLKVREAYQELDPEILKLRHPLKVDVNKLKVISDSKPYQSMLVDVDIPVFARASINDTEWMEIFEHTENNGSYRTANYKFNISSPLPIIPKRVRTEAKKAKALTYRVYAESIETELLNEVPAYFPQPSDARTMILWKPRETDLKVELEKVVDKDPLLVLSWNRPYLVTTWTEPNEEPFEELLSKYRSNRV